MSISRFAQKYRIFAVASVPIVCRIHQFEEKDLRQEKRMNFPSVRDALRHLDVGIILDGEVVAFDILSHRGKSLLKMKWHERRAVLAHELFKPPAVREALLTGRVLDDPVERDVLADDDLSHLGSPLLGLLRCCVC